MFMARPKSSLKKRQSLVWETYGIAKYEKESPSFFLMDSDWILKITPGYYSGKTSPSTYAISLEKCSGELSFSPFEVLTYLEDRRNNVQIYCSQLIVSSICETLYKASIDSIYEKLPGLKIYDDLAIVCQFYPSTGLSLSPITLTGSRLRIRYSLVWKTAKPNVYQNRESSLFNFKNLKWKLELSFTSSGPYPNFSNYYKICLRNCSEISLFEPFEVKTYLEDRRNHLQFLCSCLIVSSTCEVLYKASIDRIYEKLPGLKLHEDLAVICIFMKSTQLTFSDDDKDDIELTLERSELLNNATNFEENALNSFSPNYSDASSKFLHNFESLSKDFSSLYLNSFTADIQLKSGEDIIPVHKAILAARSQTFMAKIQQELTESNTGVVEIKDIEPVVLRVFLGYLYSGKVPADLSENELCELYKASDKYAVPVLRKLCSCYMVTQLRIDNFIKFLVLSDTHNDKEFKDAIVSFIAERPGLTLNDDWITFRKEFPNLAIEVYHKHVEKNIEN